MTILVTGATGTVGRQVVDHLIKAGRRVRALTRNPASANLRNGIEVVAGDLNRPETLEPALEGMTAIHLINFDGATSAPLQTGPEFVRRAVEAGVRRVTTFRGEARGPIEQALEEGDLAWADLFIPVEFMANTLGWADSIRSEGVVRAFGPTASAMIHEGDIGAVVATVLVEDDHAGKTYTLTGPKALTLSDKVRTLSEALGHPIRLAELAEAQAREKWKALGYPEETVDFLVAWYRDTPETAYTVLPTVQQITGRPPRTFAQWVAEHADVFRP